MSQSDIDRDWNVWKQAAEIVNRELQLWRDAPFADELQAVASTLVRIGYLSDPERRRLLAHIARLER